MLFADAIFLPLAGSRSLVCHLIQKSRDLFRRKYSFCCACLHRFYRHPRPRIDKVYHKDPRKAGFSCSLFRDSEINKSPFLLVFRLVFCVASRVTCPDMRPLMRLEYEPESCAISGNYLFPSPLRLWQGKGDSASLRALTSVGFKV